MTRHAAHLARAAGGIAPVVAVSLGVLGCSASEREETIVAPATSAAASAVMGERTGLETQWWVARDSSDALAALAALDPAPVDAATADRLAAAGVRLRSVAIEDLDAVRVALGPVGSADIRQWLGVVTEWSELASGDRFRALDAGDGASIPSGRPRIAVRCYPLPGTTAGVARVRVEVAVEAAGVGRAPASWIAEPGRAYLLVPERPGVVWQDLLERARPETDAEADSLAAGPIGPEAPVAPTIGEAVLMSSDRRAVVVLRPHVPSRFGLLD